MACIQELKCHSHYSILEGLPKPGDYVKKAKFSPQDLRILKNIVSARAEVKKGKSNSHKIDRARKDAEVLINDLVEFSQRKDLISFAIIG